MEEIIAREGDDQITLTHVMLPGAMKFDPDAVYPVTWNFEQNRPPIGEAKNIRRNEEGHIIADIEIFDAPYKDDLKPPMVSFAALSDDIEWGTKLEIAKENIKQTVESTTLRSVGCVINAGNPTINLKEN